MSKNKWLTLLIFTVIIIFFGSCTSTPALHPQQGYVSVKGGKVWYRVFGNGNKTPIMMLHGGPGGTSRSFYQFAAIGNERPVIIFDQLGGGRSDSTSDTSILKVDNFIEQVEAVRKALHLNSFYLHGHSWGTALALEYYLKYPKAVKGIIFNSPYFSTPVWKADADTLISTLPDSIQAAIATGEKNHDYESEAYKNANEVFTKHFGLRNTRLTSTLDTVPVTGSSFIYNYMWGPTEFTATGTLLHYDRVSSLPSIQVPVLFITGEFDEARPATVKRFRGMVWGSKFVEIPGSGHATMHDNLPANTKAIIDFLHDIETE
jgi:proline iminopeptidase